MTYVDPLAGARAIAGQNKAEMFIEAGAILNDVQMLDRFGYAPERLAEMREKAAVLALEREEGWFYPAFQFNGGGSLIYRLAEYLGISSIDSLWAVLDRFPAGPDLRGMTILQAMQGERADVLELEPAQTQGGGFS